jgi:hypothetical protein
MKTNFNRIVIILLGLIMLGCGRKDRPMATVFLSNHSRNRFDKSFFEVFINDDLVLADSVKNRYLSFHWKDSAVVVPGDDFKLRVIVNSNGYTLEKDTTVCYTDGLKVFIVFNFSPYFKRYHNPEIYKYLPHETARLKEIADSLYANDVLSNANEYLNDTVPLRKNIAIEIK